MRQIFLGIVLLSTACSGGSEAKTSVPGCERADHLGDFIVSFTKVSGDCGTPLDEHASYGTLEQTGPCERVQPDAWSSDNCTRHQHFQCGKVEFLTELTLVNDDSLAGRETRIISGGCTGSYDVTLTRR